MGLFDHFPYTNFHELNLDWIIKSLKGVDAKLDAALELIENKITDLVNEPEIRAEIERIVEEYLTPEQIDAIAEELAQGYLEPMKEELQEQYDDLVEDINNTPFAQPFPDFIPLSNVKGVLYNTEEFRIPQGSCCDGTYFYVYRNAWSGGPGKLDKYDMHSVLSPSLEYTAAASPEPPVEIGTNQWEKISEVSVDAGHGNSLVYKADEEAIYIAEYTTGPQEPADQQIPSTLIKVVSVAAGNYGQIIRTIELNEQLLGLGYNSKRKIWVGYQIMRGNVKFNNLVFYDENFRLISSNHVDINTHTRAGLYADDDYIFIINSRGTARGFARGGDNPATGGDWLECRLTIFDWDLRYRGETCFYNTCEIESIAWTGEAHVAVFYQNYMQGTVEPDTIYNTPGFYSYTAFLQLYPTEPVTYSWYRNLWGQNQRIWWARREADLDKTYEGAYVTGFDTKAAFSATHLEINLAQDLTASGNLIVLPRAIGQTRLSQWFTVVLNRTNDVLIQSMRFDQLPTGIQIGAIRTRTIDSEGISAISNEPYLKIREVRACNYTMQPRTYNNYLLRPDPRA